ncbi:hypothetical protein HRbin08_00950 [bacterium HR08]|nr:hypothetical protein HRbin08_00950 [bacterium HR08]
MLKSAWGAAVILWIVMGQKPFEEKLHDPHTDRPYPLVRSPLVTYRATGWEVVGEFYRAIWTEVVLSFGLTERGATEVVAVGEGMLEVAPREGVEFLEGGTREPHPIAPRALSVKIRNAYLRVHPEDVALRIARDRLAPAREEEALVRAETIHRERFGLYFVHDGLAVIPPPGVRVLDAEITDGRRLVILDAPGIKRSVLMLPLERR